jgi:hypothetical protein
MMAGAICLRPRGVLDRSTISFIVRCAVATVVMAGAVISVGAAPLALKIAVGIVVYGVGALSVGAISSSELRSLSLRIPVVWRKETRRRVSDV